MVGLWIKLTNFLVLEDEQTAGAIATLLFSLTLTFNGVIQITQALPGFWIFSALTFSFPFHFFSETMHLTTTVSTLIGGQAPHSRFKELIDLNKRNTNLGITCSVPRLTSDLPRLRYALLRPPQPSHNLRGQRTQHSRLPYQPELRPIPREISRGGSARPAAQSGGHYRLPILPIDHGRPIPGEYQYELDDTMAEHRDHGCVHCIQRSSSSGVVLCVSGAQMEGASGRRTGRGACIVEKPVVVGKFAEGF